VLMNDANTILASVRCRPASNRTKSSVLLDDDNKNVVDVHDNNHAHRYAPNDSHKQSTITARFALLL
jgi:hypothetical protein